MRLEHRPRTDADRRADLERGTSVPVGAPDLPTDVLRSLAAVPAGGRGRPAAAVDRPAAVVEPALRRTLLEDALGGLGEGGDAFGAPLLREGVAAGAGQLAVGEGQLAGLGERDERGGAESEFAAASRG